MTFDQALARLMADYDAQFPHAGDFSRGSYEWEARKILGAIYALGMEVA